MQFDNLNELIQMGGHGPYVWAAYFITLLTIVYLIWMPLARKRHFFIEQRRLLRREEYQAKQAAVEAKPADHHCG